MENNKGRNKRILIFSVIGIVLVFSLAIFLIRRSSDEDVTDPRNNESIRAEYGKQRDQFVLDLPCGVTDFDSPYAKAVVCDPDKMKKGEIVSMNFSGVVLDEIGAPVKNAKIVVNNGNPIFSNEEGSFGGEVKVDSIKQALNVSVDAYGYSPIRKVYFAKSVSEDGKEIVFPKEYNVGEISLKEAEVREAVLESSKDTVIVSDKYEGLSVTIPAGGLENSKGEVVTGEVVGEITYVDPNNPEDLMYTPGFESGNNKQMIGVDTKGNQIILVSSGLVFFHVKQKGSDELLQPRKGVLVKITQPIPEADLKFMKDPEMIAKQQMTEEELVKAKKEMGIDDKNLTEDEIFNKVVGGGFMGLYYWYFNQRTGLWEPWPVKGMETDLEKGVYILSVPSFY